MKKNQKFTSEDLCQLYNKIIFFDDIYHEDIDEEELLRNAKSNEIREFQVYTEKAFIQSIPNLIKESHNISLSENEFKHLLKTAIKDNLLEIDNKRVWTKLFKEFWKKRGKSGNITTNGLSSEEEDLDSEELMSYGIICPYCKSTLPFKPEVSENETTCSKCGLQFKFIIGKVLGARGLYEHHRPDGNYVDIRLEYVEGGQSNISYKVGTLLHGNLGPDVRHNDVVAFVYKKGMLGLLGYSNRPYCVLNFTTKMQIMQ